MEPLYSPNCKLPRLAAFGLFWCLHWRWQESMTQLLSIYPEPPRRNYHVAVGVMHSLSYHLYIFCHAKSPERTRPFLPTVIWNLLHDSYVESKANSRRGSSSKKEVSRPKCIRSCSRRFARESYADCYFYSTWNSSIDCKLFQVCISAN